MSSIPSDTDDLNKVKLFIESYYRALDASSATTTPGEQEVGKFYGEKSKIVWNGTAFDTPAAFEQMLQKLAKSQHSVESYNCHTVPGVGSSSALAIIVSGQVTHTSTPKDNTTRPFSQSFLLAKTPAVKAPFPGYGIVADSYRFVGAIQ
ncbi:NTF2-like protein [Atractiella rhizophila]|nr:NTF2-like protein [Atractiella rhizophila]